ncbi:uncharacterized protein HMPREF1541_02874 [Cyphellophora europaea CBS 101466]|uniref:Uncharacterized protein n=1 Tax=Cyphellophora europaea (strain CBS 101466) TaxID=1220924 RepID=W2S533_CYPE1|nr:uncharacterized protein HMPREF1541_02874 [Cyphellophora europaea CBS 101466]ETN43715.1 hypothetical protein HMPREF1541_02874 [Cyphellophora europaea CBS 101466]
MSTRNKPRLYLALYPRGACTPHFTSSSNCSSYHFSLLVGPGSSLRSDPGKRYHVAHTDDIHHPFLYEETDIQASDEYVPLVRVTLAKVRNSERVTALLRTVEVPSTTSSALECTCLAWTAAAFRLLVADKGSGNRSACLSSYLKPADWDHVEGRARKYVKRKRDVRRWDSEQPGPWDRKAVSTWNYWENRETTV